MKIYLKQRVKKKLKKCFTVAFLCSQSAKCRESVHAWLKKHGKGNNNKNATLQIKLLTVIHSVESIPFRKHL